MLVWMCHSLLGRREGKETKYCHAICSSGLNYTVCSLLCAVLCVFVICVVCVVCGVCCVFMCAISFTKSIPKYFHSNCYLPWVMIRSASFGDVYCLGNSLQGY